MDWYRPLFGKRHLDIGPGSGYCIDNGAAPDTDLTLLDPNLQVLAHCAKRLARFDPTLVEADVLKPLPVEGPFDSVALSFVLHCLPGPMDRKSDAITNAAAVLAPDGVLFGGTVLGVDEPHNAPARAFIRFASKRGLFDNLGDTRDGLETILHQSFAEVEIDVRGSLAMFTARDPTNA